jgi:hypothetical protein
MPLATHSTDSRWHLNLQYGRLVRLLTPVYPLLVGAVCVQVSDRLHRQQKELESAAYNQRQVRPLAEPSSPHHTCQCSRWLHAPAV